MKKKFLALFLVFLCATFCFAGCDLGSYIDKNPSTSTKPGDNKPGGGDDDNPDIPTPTDTHYRVQVIYNNAYFNPGDNVVTVIWRNEFDMVDVELGADGKADAGELDGDYTVYLEGLPSKYTYDPNANTATSDARLVSILITDVLQPVNASRADGKDLYINNGCYNVRYDGTYRAQIDDANDVRYYEYTPTASGIYSIVSKVNVYDDAINPKIEIWNGTIAYKWYDSTLDGGGPSLPGGFTKNFRYEVRIAEGSVGSSFSFAIRAVSKTHEYPVNVDFSITYEGEYKNSYDDVRVIRMQEKRLQKPALPTVGQSFIAADLGTKTFNNNNYKFNDATGVYHYYNMEEYGNNSLGFGAGYGPKLLCAITPRIACYTQTTLYNANAVPNPGTGGTSNYLLVYNVWLEDEQKYVTYDYTEFIRTDYYGVCNSQGYCFVTKELKDFLYKFANNLNLWSDNTMTELLDGTPEKLGYIANEDALWLFACGFYGVPN